MPKRDAAPIGAPCWVELFTSDPDQSRAFYGSLFEWTSEDAGPDYGGYINFSKGGVPIAGCMRNDASSGAPDGWSIYLATDNAEKTVADATSAGAHVIVPATPVMALGSMAVVTDPGGATIGAWQPGEHKGFGEYGEPNTPSWFELHTREYEKSVAFYRDVFKWNTRVESDTPEFKYTTLESAKGDEQYAGIMDASAFLPAGVPAQWSVYFGTDDTDKTLARIADLGGKIVMPTEDTPYGRLAQAADNTGVLFKLVAGNR